MSTNVFDGIIVSIELLKKNNAVAKEVRLTQAQYDALKADPRRVQTVLLKSIHN